MKNDQVSADLELALELADIADSITMAYFGKPDLSISQKADLTPVSEADRLVEQALRDYLAKARPSDGVLGEEYGEADSPNGRLWIIDPIDGTKNYIRGVPVWATLIGLADNVQIGTTGAISGDITVGVVSAPALDRRWYAAKNQGAFLKYRGETRPIKVSQIDVIKEASISYASLSGWREIGKLPQFLELNQECARSRAYGDFWSYMLVAEGAVDIAAEPELEVYDMAALVPIVTEAGGTFTSLQGEPGPWGGNALATNGLLYRQVLQYLG